MISHKHNLNAIKRLDGSLDPLKSRCTICKKYFEFNLWTHETNEITKMSMDYWNSIWEPMR